MKGKHNIMNKRKLTMAASLLLLPALFAQQRFDARVRADFFAGFAGDNKALDRAMTAAEQTISRGDGATAEAMAWHGSGLLFQAGDKFAKADYQGGGEMWSKAVAEADEAGRREPDNPAVLIPRAAAWFAASRVSPPQMGKPILQKALADYEHVYDLQKVFFDRLGSHPRGELLFGLADGYARDGNPEKARFYFSKLAEVGAVSGHLEQAQQYLSGDKYAVKGVGCHGCHVEK